MEYKRKVKKQAEYHLTGWMGVWHDGEHDPDTFFGVNLNQAFNAVNDDAAIGEAKSRIEKFIAGNPKHDPASFPSEERGTDYWKHSFSFRMEKEVFTMCYRSGEAARPAIPAQPAVPSKPATPDYIEETLAT